MTVDGHNGKVDFGYKALGKLFLAMALACSIPVGTGFVVGYGDKRVIEEKVGVLERTDERHSERLEKHEGRITTLEAKQAIEE